MSNKIGIIRVDMMMGVESEIWIGENPSTNLGVRLMVEDPNGAISARPAGTCQIGKVSKTARIQSGTIRRVDYIMQDEPMALVDGSVIIIQAHFGDLAAIKYIKAFVADGRSGSRYLDVYIEWVVFRDEWGRQKNKEAETCEKLP